MTTRIALIGLGEVGRILAEDLGRAGASLAAWDLKFADPSSPPSRAAAELALRLRQAASAPDAVRGASLVISAVTAAQTLEAARAAAPGLAAGAFYLDLNSASPGMKRAAAEVVEAAGGRYVEAAVMSPYPPKRLGTPKLLGGPHAEAFLLLARELGFTGVRVFAPEVGKASAAKMCRSVMIKGIEALLSESLLSARHYGVEDVVLASLKDLFPAPDWPTLSRYMISRTLEHGARRAEEMWEVARTVEEAGVAPLMSTATAKRQDWAPQWKAALAHDGLEPMLDSVRAQVTEKAAHERPAIAKHVKFAAIPFADQDRALAYYRDVMGFRVMVDEPQGPARWIELKVGTSPTRILLTHPAPPPTEEPALALVTEDVDAAYAALSGKGAVFALPPTDAPWSPGDRYAIVRDSEGNLVMLASR